MKKIRGFIVYPVRIEEIVRTFPEMDKFMMHIRREKGLDEILIQIDPIPDVPKDRYPELVRRMESEL